MSQLDRRDLLTLLTLGAACLVAPAAHAMSSAWKRIELEIGGSTAFPTKALALIPPNLAGKKQRLLVLLHGYGPSSDERALRYWQKECGVERAHQRLREPPISRLYETVRYLTDRRIEELSRALAEQPFEGMTLLCPVVPAPYFMSRPGQLFGAYSDWLADRLIARARDELEVGGEPRETGLGGVSMGGQFALEALARRPEAFGAVSAVLAAVERKSARRYAARIGKALQRSDPARLQLLTATRDSYFEGNEALRVALGQKKVKADFRAPFGPHNAGWMREVGSLEMLLWMDRALGAGSDRPEAEAKRESDRPEAEAKRE